MPTLKIIIALPAGSRAREEAARALNELADNIDPPDDLDPLEVGETGRITDSTGDVSGAWKVEA